VGINVYKWSGAVHKDPSQNFENLAGATGDAIWLKAILTSKYGFRDEDVVVLTDAAATREAILNAFRSHLIAKSAPDDVALFYFAGHGSERGITSENTIVPADSRDPAGKVFDIAASDLHELFVALLEKTHNVTSVLDTCYSDTAVRGIGAKRSIATDTRMKARAASLPQVLNPIAPVVRISAARADQEAAEYTEFTADGKSAEHGLMSYKLFRELETAGVQTTWRDVMDRTRTEVAKQNPLQEPQMEAPNPDTLIFGGVGQAAQEAFLLVTPQRQNVLLNAGSLHALAAGSNLDVYPPGTRAFAGAPIAKIAVTNVSDFTSEATVVSGMAARDIPVGARAVVRSRPATAFRFRICFDGNSPVLTAVRNEALKAIPGAQEMPLIASDAVVRFGDAQFHTEWPDGTMMSPAVRADEKGAADRVVRQLMGWARWRQLLTAEGSAPVLQMKVTTGGRSISSEVTDGTTITIGLCNTGSRSFFSRVVFFSSDGAINPVDLATDGTPLAAGQCSTGGSFVITVDEGRKSSLDFFKAFATLDKIDLEPFTGAQIRGEPRDPSGWSAVTTSVTVVKR
jgi:hypothetical protein